MSEGKAFFDTNLFIYLYSDTEADADKKEKVISVLNKYERFVSTQVLSEFCSVCIRKLKLPVASVLDAVNEIMDISSLIVEKNYRF
jgi:predicted nucleic acid-binding protein